MIQKIHHLLTQSKWKSVKKDGILKALSLPWFDLYGYDGSLDHVVMHKKYVVGIPQGTIKAWERHQALREVERYVRDGGLDRPVSGESLIRLDVPVIKRGGFVREYKFRTPRFMNSVCPDLYSRVCESYRSSGMSGLSRKEMKIWIDLVKKSMLSAVSLEEYDGSFEVPEVWLPQNTPVELMQAFSYPRT